MSPGQKVLAAVIVLVAACGVIDSIGGHVLASAVSENRGLSPLEGFVAQWHLAMLRYAPFVVLPLLAAPSVVLVIWLVPALRPRRLESAAAEARILAAWLAWLVGVPILGVAMGLICAVLGLRVALGVSPWFPGTALVLIFGIVGWAYTAALHRSLRLQRQRVADGSSHIGTATFAAFATVAVLAWPVGILLPFWMLWRAKRDRVASGAA